MLKPNATRVALQKSTAELVAQFQSRGGVVKTAPVAVAGGLRKTKFIRRRKAQVQLTEA